MLCVGPIQGCTAVPYVGRVRMYGPAACAVLYICMYSCAVYWACCKDAYIIWFAKVFSGLEPHPKQGPTVRTSLPSLYFDFKIDFLHC